ncbi:MAG: histidine phosphotransferase family protein [Proteobacteria bacterium]|nr:histidine phosphotransferase family protein [Pseudomonadota bacterium]
MQAHFLNTKSQLLFAKTLHDLAAPLGALNLCIDDIKHALPDSADLIESSIETLSKRINYWRLMLTGQESSPNFADAATAIRSLAKLKGINFVFCEANEYQGVYVRLLLALAMVAIESLPRGGKVTIDANNGLVTAVAADGAKCFIPKELAEAIVSEIKDPSSRHALGILIYDLAKSCNALVKLEHEPNKLALALCVGC